MPVLLLTWIAAGQASVQSAGSLAAAHSLGILLPLLFVPATGTLFPRRQWMYAAASLLLGALVSSYWLSGAALLLCWWLAGLSAGLMQYIGSIGCSQATDQRAAFSLRLSVSLMFAGCATLIGVSGQVIGAGIPLIAMVVTLEAVALGAALIMFRGTPGQQRATPSILHKDRAIPLAGLALLFFLFVGQVGFYVYTLESVSASGSLAAHHIAVALGAAKVFVSLIMYFLVRNGLDLVSKLGFASVGFALLAGVLLLGRAQHLLLVGLGFVLWETCFNLLVAAFQGELAKKHPIIVGMWISVPVFLGAATGPVVHGWMRGGGSGFVFMLLAALSALGPAVWARASRGRLARAQG